MAVKPYYEHGGITIYHGDCREILPSVVGDVMVTDPPYGINFRSGMGGFLGDCAVAGDDSTEAREAVLAMWWPKPAIVFGSWKVRRPNGIRSLLIWDKGPHVGMGDLSFPWRPNHEDIYVLGEGYSGHRGTSVLRYNAISPNFVKRNHPTEKPLALMCELVGKCDGAVVVDPFAGSGSTLHAAKECGKRAIGVEIEERYCEIAAKRLEQEVLPLEQPA